MAEGPRQLGLFDEERVGVNPGLGSGAAAPLTFNTVQGGEAPSPDSRPRSDKPTQPVGPATDHGAGGPCILCKGPTRIMQGGAYRGPTEWCNNCGTEREIEKRRYAVKRAKA
jgi:hypothetical protein